jgi:alpha-D-ribose 1-methylphosphonate 5-triphosphate synthase subunit PhnH
MPGLSLLNPGSHEWPETSTTLILQLPALGSGAAFRLSGPGLAAPTLLRADGLPDDFAARWADNHAKFPCGIDLILCAGDRLAALPRSVTVEEA